LGLLAGYLARDFLAAVAFLAGVRFGFGASAAVAVFSDSTAVFISAKLRLLEHCSVNW
jgi:hypothetical protein